MMSVGETLRQQRLRRKVQLQEVSEELKISSRMLEAIEADDYDKLPGGVFAKSFVRQYAGVLGLDEGEVAAQFEQAVRSPELTRLEELRRPHAVSWDAQDGRAALQQRPAAEYLAIADCGGGGDADLLGSIRVVAANRQLAATRQQIPRATAARRAAPPPATQTQQPRAPIQPQPAAGNHGRPAARRRRRYRDSRSAARRVPAGRSAAAGAGHRASRDRGRAGGTGWLPSRSG